MDKIRNLLQSEMMVSGLRWWQWRWREANRFERDLELKEFGVVAWVWKREGGIKDASPNSGDVGPGHLLK